MTSTPVKQFGVRVVDFRSPAHQQAMVNAMLKLVGLAPVLRGIFAGAGMGLMTAVLGYQSAPFRWGVHSSSADKPAAEPTVKRRQVER